MTQDAVLRHVDPSQAASALASLSIIEHPDVDVSRIAKTKGFLSIRKRSGPRLTLGCREDHEVMKQIQKICVCGIACAEYVRIPETKLY